MAKPSLTLGKPETKIMILMVPQGEEWHHYSLTEKPQQRPKATPVVQSVGGAPFENVVVDFTEFPRV